MVGAVGLQVYLRAPHWQNWVDVKQNCRCRSEEPSTDNDDDDR